MHLEPFVSSRQLEGFLMAKKPTYEELEQRIKELESQTSGHTGREQVVEHQDPEKTAILDSLLEHVVYQDGEMNVLWANQAACDSVGMTREALIGRRCYEVWAGRKTLCEDCPVAKARNTGQPQTVEKSTPDGRWWFIQGYPVRDNNGETIGTVEFTLDITERKLAEEALQKSHHDLEHRVKERTAHLVAATEELKKEIEGRKAAEQDLEKSEKLLSNVFNAIEDLVVVIDKDLRVVMSNWKGDVYVPEKERKDHPHCYACFMNRETPCEPCHALGVFETGETKELEHTNPLTGNSRQIHVLPVFDNEHNVIMVVEHLRDITHRKRVEEALRKSEQEYRVLVDYANEGIVVAQDAVLKFVNPAVSEISGYSAEELTSKPFADFVHPDDREMVKEHHIKRLSGEEELEVYDMRVLDKAGNVKWLRNSGVVIDWEGRPATLVFLADITIRKQTEERVEKLSRQLMQAQESERQMIALELHDRVAQDLSSLKIACETLLDDQPEVHDEMRQKVSHLSQVCEEIITAVRELSYDLRPLGMDQENMARGISRYCQDFSEKTGLSVDFTSAGLADTRLDYDTKVNLYRLVQEALNNTRKHADAKHVTIKMLTAFPNIVLRIRDDGKGFDVEKRMATKTTEKRMGLRSMEERANLLGGKMTLQSRPGQGTKIFIEIPLKEEKDGS
jgi:PAS domain S-box-containing protein